MSEDDYMLRADATDDYLDPAHTQRDVIIEGGDVKGVPGFAIWCGRCGQYLTRGIWMYWHHAREIVERHLNA